MARPWDHGSPWGGLNTLEQLPCADGTSSSEGPQGHPRALGPLDQARRRASAPQAGLKRGPSGSPKGPRAPGSSLKKGERATGGPSGPPKGSRAPGPSLRMSAQQRALLSLALRCTLQNVWEKHNYTSIKRVKMGAPTEGATALRHYPHAHKTHLVVIETPYVCRPSWSHN